LGALSLQGVIAPMTVEGGTDAEVFGAYIKDMLAPALRPGQVVIMDNLSSHKVEGIQEAIAAVGATLEYLPPYSPDLSPIEECWSKVKETLRAKAARTRTMLDVALASALHMITPADVKGWFAHCGYA
jgi:transposase